MMGNKTDLNTKAATGAFFLLVLHYGYFQVPHDFLWYTSENPAMVKLYAARIHINNSDGTVIAFDAFQDIYTPRRSWSLHQRVE